MTRVYELPHWGILIDLANVRAITRLFVDPRRTHGHFHVHVAGLDNVLTIDVQPVFETPSPSFGPPRFAVAEADIANLQECYIRFIRAWRDYTEARS